MGNSRSHNERSQVDERDNNNRPEAPSFIFSSETITHDPESTLPTCCDSPGECRAYSREDDSSRAVGMYCRHCHAEWLDPDIYPFGKFDREDQVAVQAVKLKTAQLDPCESAVFNISSGERYVLSRKEASTGSVSDLFRCFLRAIPNRTMIEHRSPAMNSLEPGTHVMWHRPWGCWHHQLIVRRTARFKYDIIHFDTTDDQRVGFKVEVMERFARSFEEEHGVLYRVNYSPSVERENPVALVLDRAKAKLHEGGFNLLTHNCEHVISFCKTGFPNSYQGSWLKRGLFFLVARIIVISVVIVVASVIEPILPEMSIESVTVVSPSDATTPLSIVNDTAFIPTLPNISTTACSRTCFHGTDDKRSEIVEALVVPLLEIAFFCIVVWRHFKAFRDHGIAATDFARRVGEAIFELVCTVSFFLLHIPFSEYLSLAGDVVLALTLGIAGKLIGFFLGQYLCQKTVVKRRLRDLGDLSRRRSEFLSASFDIMRKYDSTVDYHSA